MVNKKNILFIGFVLIIALIVNSNNQQSVVKPAQYIGEGDFVEYNGKVVYVLDLKPPYAQIIDQQTNQIDSVLIEDLQSVAP